jgi:CDGSH-type Zn-finger protein
MSRIVKRIRNAPYTLAGGETRFICGCGLSANLPFCDGTHKLTDNEVPGKLYWYDSAERRHDAEHGYSDITSDEPASASARPVAATAV